MMVREHSAELAPDASRVVARLFLPGESASSPHSRAAEIVARVMVLPQAEVETMAAELVADFSRRHSDVAALFRDNAKAVGSRISSATPVTDAQMIVLGASFTSEYAVEGAALCNPSAVEHPDQSGLQAGELRVALALRSIGEGHLSSIGFAEAVIGADGTWTFAERTMPLSTAVVTEGSWSRAHFRRAIQHEGHLNELSSTVLHELPERFTASQLEAALVTLPVRLTAQRDNRLDTDTLRTLVSSAYLARFPDSTVVSQRVLLPVSAEEDHGMEDARFVRFTEADGSASYRATYTAYDGREVAPRLITSPDLVSFAIHRLSGSAAHNKGMALFPRLIGNEHLALSRTDGENISLARSKDGVIWADAGIVHRPTAPWEVIQTGNCGSPIETPAGWIALIHGVGPMRSYCMGALLLDLDDPAKVIGRTKHPFLRPTGSREYGYVPNVVYSCGGILHNGTLWIPVGIGDCRIGIFSVGLDELLSSMTTD